MPNNFPAVFHNMSNYDYHFIMKELENNFKGQLEYLGGKQKSETIFSF